MRRHSQAIILTGLLSGIFSGPAFGQPSDPGSLSPGFIVDTWPAKEGSPGEGLPGSSVISMVQTRDGYLWLGTLYGLVRFDGVRFTVFDEVNTPELGSSRVVYLFEDSQGRLWVGTETAGVVLVAEGRARNIGLASRTHEGRLVSACEDESGAVWLLTANGQLGRYAEGMLEVADISGGLPGTFRSVVVGAENNLWVGLQWMMFSLRSDADLVNNPLRHLKSVPVPRLDLLLNSPGGGFWTLSSGGIQLWRDDTKVRDLGAFPWPGSTLVTSACEDEQGNLIVGTRSQSQPEVEGGVYWFNSDGRAKRISRAEGLSNNSVLSVCMDREGDLWVGTDGGGLNRVRRSSFTTVPGTESWVVQSVCQDADGAIWIGANQGHLGRWKDGQLQRFSTTDQPVQPSVRSVFADSDNNLWVGTWNGGLFRLNQGRFGHFEGLPGLNPVVLAITEDPAGTLWFGTAAGLTGWTTNGESRTLEGLSRQAVRAIAAQSADDLWVGTEGAGLVHVSEGLLQVHRKQNNGLPSDNISSLLLDDHGVLWIGMPGAGLARLEKDHWTHYTTAQGLTANGIGYLLEDNDGHLWMGSNAGLMSVRKSELNEYAAGKIHSLTVRTFGEAEGLPSRETTIGSQPGALRTPDGRLWFPTTKGLASLDPAKLRPNPHAPPVVIESVRVDGQLRSAAFLGATPPRFATLTPGDERLEIEFTSLNLAAPQRTRFRYRMVPHEPNWIEVLNTRVVRYSKLPPGHYTFQVTAGNEDGVWNESGARLTVVVEPPFWRTWWFLSGVAMALLATIVVVVHFVSTQRLQREVAALREKEALERERARIARDLHDQLGANLTQVALLGELAEADKEDPGEVEDHARQISQTARETTHALDEIVWAANPSNDTLEGLINYTCKYAQEYLAMAGLRYRLDVPPSPPDCPLPPELRHNVFLAVKEAVNNVVKHAKASEARLRLRLEPGQFVIEVEDDGRGPGEIDSEHAKTRNGLRNMRQRMEDVGGRFEIRPAGERGTVVRLTAPLNPV